MRMYDIIQRKKAREELTEEEIANGTADILYASRRECTLIAEAFSSDNLYSGLTAPASFWASPETALSASVYSSTEANCDIFKRGSVPTVVYVDRKPKEIECNGKYNIIELPGNIGYDIEFKTDIGENEIEITLTVGNRNLLGPFHTQEYEPTSIGPYSFERLGTWTNGKSSILRESYSFVKTLI